VALINCLLREKEKEKTIQNIEILFMSNEMQLFMFFITDALHVSGVLRPSSGAL
jgi:hypothetical protein